MSPVIDRKTKHLRLRPVVCALCLFILLNLGLSLGSSNIWGKPVQERSVVFQACDSAVRQFEHFQPAVVMMGSSVMMAPLWSVDVQRFHQISDVYHYHQSQQMQQLLSLKSKQAVGVFTFALPGAMVSDGYLLTEKLLKDKQAPRVLVYGLSPRDLMDDLLTGETRTSVFQRLMTLSDLPRIGHLYLSSWSEKFDFIANNVCFLYGKRARYQQKAISLLNGILNKISASRQKLDTAGGVDAAAAGFLLEANRQQVWQKSIEEYKARYRHFNLEQFEKQKRFLEQTLLLCKSRGIQVYLVNMPLSRDNLRLMDAAMYDRYLQSVNGLSKKHGCGFINLQQAAGFDDSCFYDTVHLNARGGDKLISTLSERIVL